MIFVFELNNGEITVKLGWSQSKIGVKPGHKQGKLRLIRVKSGWSQVKLRLNQGEIRIRPNSGKGKYVFLVAELFEFGCNNGFSP